MVNQTTVNSEGLEYRNELFYNAVLGTDYYINAYNVITLSGNFAYEIEDQPSETNFSFLNEGLFKPYVPSRDVQELFAKRAEELNAPNPFDAAVDVMDRIRDILESVPIRADVFPDIQNPFSNLPEPTLGAAASLSGLPAMPNPGLVNNTQFGNIDPVSRLTLAEETYLSPLEQNYRKKTRTV